ncbi:MAG: FUSC family protein [Candidatus Eremiobacteraeota bacterium]|nr:FUSC family protein [Candidatus Eremiobacteraeota bacterium]
MSAAATQSRSGFAGLPLSSWAYAIRIWIAVVIALGISFWLQLEAPFSAVLTIAILAEPARGQALQKAAYRAIATIIGVAASIAITGLFSQERDLLLAAFAAWLGLAVYAAGLLDGYRAYAAVLSGYTVGLIAVQQIDTPQHVFESAFSRGAAIAVGIMTITVVNNVLFAPDLYPQVLAKLTAIHRRIREHAKAVIRGGAADPTAAAALIGDIVALRRDVTSVATESSSGPVRSAAARSTTVALVAELHAVRALDALPAASDPALGEQLISALDRTMQQPPSLTANDARSWAAAELLRRDEEVRLSLSALKSGTRPPHAWRAPLYRSHRAAFASGIRAAAWFAMAASVLVLAGWSAASSSLAIVSLVVGIGATTPSPGKFTAIAFIAAPIAVAVTGILEFVILDGASDFPLLAMGLAPFVIGAALLMTLPNQFLSSLGRLNLFFGINILAPSNPQTYDPQNYLFVSFFLCLGVAVLFAAQLLIPPVSNDSRRRWLLASARRDLDLALSRRGRQDAPEEAMYRDAVRVEQIAGAGGTAPQHRDSLAQALWYFDQAAAIRLCGDKLTQLASGPFAKLAAEARTALAARDAPLIRAIAASLRAAAGVGDRLASATSAALDLASAVIEASPLHAGNAARSKS